MEDKTKVSVSEFKNWLSGVLDFQPEDWTPNSEQWKKILDKIGQLDETAIASTEVKDKTVVQPPVQRKRPVGPMSENSELGKAEGTTDVVGSVVPPSLDHKVQLPDLPEKERHVTVQRNGPPKVMGDGKERVIDTGEVHKMGVIDTTDGKYKSSFV